MADPEDLIGGGISGEVGGRLAAFCPGPGFCRPFGRVVPGGVTEDGADHANPINGICQRRCVCLLAGSFPAGRFVGRALYDQSVQPGDGQ
ncbi:MAG: hypothetical protein GY778_22855 [bacterium]|nr:hypothetical protein [bacterium]